MTPESPKLSLWTIENALVELIQAREEVEAAASAEDRQLELAEIDKAIAEYIRAEVGKVDNIRGFLKHAEMMAESARNEARAQATRAAAWQARVTRVKQIVQDVMAQTGMKRIEGRTGHFLVKGNGGVQPLIVTDEAQIPEECVRYVGWISGPAWRELIDAWSEGGAHSIDTLMKGEFSLQRVVDNDAVRRNLPVPGAHLGERGSHLEIK